MGVDAAFAPAGADALYHVMGGSYAPILSNSTLGGPNGVATSSGGVFVVTFNSGQVYRVTGENEYEEILAVQGGQLDGIEILDNGDILVSNWSTSCVHLLDTEGNLSCLIPDVEAPADIGHFGPRLMLFDSLDDLLFCVSLFHVEISVP
jgi:sugar lactone lactonase YvrE